MYVNGRLPCRLGVPHVRAIHRQVATGRGPRDCIPFTSRAKQVLELSLREALSLKSDYIGTEHLLLGLIAEGKGAGAQVLAKLGTPLRAVRDKAIELATADPDSVPAGPSPTPFVVRQRAEIAEIRDLLTAVDRRLAAIEERLGIGGLPEEPDKAPPAAYDAQ